MKVVHLNIEQETRNVRCCEFVIIILLAISAGQNEGCKQHSAHTDYRVYNKDNQNLFVARLLLSRLWSNDIILRSLV